MRESKSDREAGQTFHVEANAAIWESIANILPQMLASDEIIESTISEKIKQLQDEKNKQFAAKIEPKLDAYIRDGNDETFFDYENVSCKWHPSPKKRNYINLNV